MLQSSRPALEQIKKATRWVAFCSSARETWEERRKEMGMECYLPGPLPEEELEPPDACLCFLDLPEPDWPDWLLWSDEPAPALLLPEPPPLPMLEPLVPALEPASPPVVDDPELPL